MKLILEIDLEHIEDWEAIVNIILKIMEAIAPVKAKVVYEEG